MHRSIVISALVLASFLAGCGSDSVGSEEDAQKAYLGLDASIDKAIALGLKGFNEASNANIPTETAKGNKSGTLTVTGQVDQGASANKSMHLSAAMSGYSDDGALTYDTAGTAPALAINLKGIPDGTMDGSLEGDYSMSGDLEGDLHLSLSFTGEIQPVMGDTTKVERKPGTTHIHGTASAGDASYSVDVTR